MPDLYIGEYIGFNELILLVSYMALWARSPFS